MPHRLAFSIGVAAVAVFAAIAPLTGQTPARSAGPERPAPRTPWGDPDIQGTYTNTYENGTPFERPDEFAGRKLEDIKGDELKKIKREAQQRAVTAFQGPIHAPDNWWQDNLFLERGSQAWFVVDPEDGKIAASTIAASRAVCLDRCCRRFTAISIRSSRRPGMSRSATR
jgi:hypothetical protein